MADPVSLALIATTVMAVGGQVFGGISSKKAAEDQADLMRDQAALARQEAELEAQRKEEERTKFIAKQKVAFLANGVGLGGSAQDVFADTFSQFQQEIDAVRRTGNAQATFQEREAKLTEKSGRARLISGVLGGGQTAAGNFVYGKQQNIF